ncbi:MAG: chromosome segregation protein [Flavobacteriales bacterium]|jgi:chromosome segregation protein
MRLKTIKLAGFKSFVDPTTVNLKSNMCAVVGPNGCGKSNIIDAVRWVLGESSAKNLRGESMTDVIFNGSASRKPVGQASIELIFDNTDGTITGEYAGYNEISIKRRVTRDSQNIYYLNGNRCRRRDITDIFLGTGLGPRSYAIIEQGMISRLIESKPDELRVYIEEAAGISKYKERRKDTENRMRRTHENLERLTDIREELERQLIRLERQAKAAEKFGIFKQEERELNAKLRTVRYLDIKSNADGLETTIRALELQVEAAVTQRVKFDTAIEKYRTDFSERSDAFNEVQGRYYSIGSDIARIEQSIQHAKERESSLRKDIEQNNRDCREAREHLQLDDDKIEGWQAELLEMAPELEIYEQSVDESNDILLDAEQSMQDWQSNWDQFNQKAAAPKQQAEVQQSRIQYLEQVQQRLISRKGSLSSELEGLVIDEGEADIAADEEILAQLEENLELKSALISEKSELIDSIREEQDSRAKERNQIRVELQTGLGRKASLDALQSAALGKEGTEKIKGWLDANNLSSAKRLAEELEIESGWERALEVVLGDSLQALISETSLDSVVASLPELDGSLNVFARGEHGAVSSSGLKSLAELVKSPVDLGPFLSNIKIADSLESAQEKISQLSSTESIVTPEGYWLSAQWIRVSQGDATESGVIARQKEIELLDESLELLEEKVHELDETYEAGVGALKEAETLREETRKALEEENRESRTYRSNLSSRRAKIEQVTQQNTRVKQDVAEIDQQLAQESENLSEGRALLEEAMISMESDSEEREELLNKRDSYREKLDQARQKARHDQDKAHELAMRSRSVQAQLDSIKQGVQRLNEQIARMEERRDILAEQLEESSCPAGDQELELEGLLEKRISVEQKLNESRRAVEDAEQGLRHSEKSRDGAEQEITTRRASLESTRLKLKSFDVHAQNIEQQLSDDEFDVDSVKDLITEEDTENNLEEGIAHLAVKISRLGAINLAAIEEYATESERKSYLDEQNQDLCDALDTLEGAIRRIDKETRTRFKETYDKVNSGLQDLFPRLFGGGHAYLELTGDDLLDTGIAIMAQPPGKKNSTIYLLSGGEKALTAIALVFSIFHLNPAPFCMLDEVDAPLDDANVARYANIVEYMSDKVQFIYITHNKVAMEKAKHLMGVTMQEPGVSRMVTVDVEEAAELAAM